MKTAKKSLRFPDYLQHILDAIQQIETYIEGVDQQSFMNNRMMLDAVIRNIEIIGEAARNIVEHSPEFSEQHATIPWNAMYAMRNRLAHGYFSVDAHTVWQTTKNDLPLLQEQISQLLEVHAEQEKKAKFLAALDQVPNSNPSPEDQIK